MADAVVLSPDTYRYIDQAIKQIMASGFVRRSELPAIAQATPYKPILCKNVSPTFIPAYGCVQVTDSTDIDNVTYLEVEDVVDSFGYAGPYLFNGPNRVEVGGTGEFFAGPHAVAVNDGSAVTVGDAYAPLVGFFILEQQDGGPFIALCDDAVSGPAMQVIYNHQPLFMRFTMNEDWSSGVADCDILWPDGTDTGADKDVLDPLGIYSPLGNGDAGWCFLQGGALYAIQAPCGG